MMSYFLLILLGDRLVETSLHRVVRIRGHWSIAPQPAHHLRHDRAAKLLPVQIHAPRVVHVVTLLCEGLHQPYILQEPIALLVVNTVADAAIIISPVAQKDSDRLLLACQYPFGIYVSTPNICETAHVAQHLAELVGALPGYRECCNRSRTRAADSVQLRIPGNVVLL